MNSKNSYLGKFKIAFESLRQHKMDINILFDMDQHFFISNAEEIINQLKKPAHVNSIFRSYYG